MVQNKVLVRQRTRKPVPLVPTLIICVGKYGRDVGVQLAARLLLTEDALYEDGLNPKHLLYCVDEDGNESPGLIRIMELDWEQWFASGYAPNKLLQNVCIAGASIAQDGTEPCRCEEDMLLDDITYAKQELPKTLEHLIDIVQPLRTHDTPLRVGNFLPQGQDKFVMRVIVVCAAREPASVLVPALVRLLGMAYVSKLGVTKGIELICSVATTSRDEHTKANGSDADFDELFKIEVARILPKVFQSPTAMPSIVDPLLDQLEQMWQMKSPQTIESCYLIDKQLANLVSAVQTRQNEPDEIVVAAALAITLFITGNADGKVRQSLSRRWDVTKGYAYTEPGFFSSLGVASYALDHPKLRQLVYSYIVGRFLLQAQPAANGDHAAQNDTINRHQGEELLDKQLDAQLDYSVQKMLQEYEKSIAFKTIERKVPKAVVSVNKKIDYKRAINALQRVNAGDRQEVKKTLEEMVEPLAEDISENALKLRIMERQQLYQVELENAFQGLYFNSLRAEQAPLTTFYRFSTKGLATLKEEAYKADAPLTQKNLAAAMSDFIYAESANFSDEVVRRADALRRCLRHRPSTSGAFGRALVIAPLFVVLLLASAPIWDLLLNPFTPWISKIHLFTEVYNYLYALPAWVGAASVVPFLWSAIFSGHLFAYRRSILHQLRLVAKRYEDILKKADQEAWRWALAASITEQEKLVSRITTLSRPNAIVSNLRDTLLATEFVAQDRVLERIFFDAQLQMDLQEISQLLAARDKLWERRHFLLDELVNRQSLDQSGIRKWLLEEAEKLYHDDSKIITDLVTTFLKYQTLQRLEEMLHDLSNAAVPFLRHSLLSQEDPVVQLEMFGVYSAQELMGLDTLAKRSDVEVLDSVDRLRWIFMRTQMGLHLHNIKFTAETSMSGY